MRISGGSIRCDEDAGPAAQGHVLPDGHGRVVGVGCFIGPFYANRRILIVCSLFDSPLAGHIKGPMSDEEYSGIVRDAVTVQVQGERLTVANINDPFENVSSRRIICGQNQISGQIISTACTGCCNQSGLIIDCRTRGRRHRPAVIGNGYRRHPHDDHDQCDHCRQNHLVFHVILTPIKISLCSDRSVPAGTSAVGPAEQNKIRQPQGDRLLLPPPPRC